MHDYCENWSKNGVSEGNAWVCALVIGSTGSSNVSSSSYSFRLRSSDWSYHACTKTCKHLQYDQKITNIVGISESDEEDSKSFNSDR